MANPDELEPIPPRAVPGARHTHRPGARYGRILVAAVALVAAVGMILPVMWGDPGGVGATTAAHAAAATPTAAMRVEVVRPTRGGVRRVTMQPGSVHAFESVDLYAKASGFLKTQTVDIGSPIRRGEVLAEIDAPELQRDVDEAAATVEQCKAQVDQATSRVVTAEAEREAAESAVAQTESDLNRLTAKRVLAERAFVRISELYARNAVDHKLVEEQEEDQESSRAAERTGTVAIRTARAQATAAVAKVAQAKSDVIEARAAIRVAEARLERAKVLAGYTRVTAPFDGVVTHRTFHPGAFIRSAADGAPEMLLTVMRTDKMRVVIQVPDLDVPLLDVGDKVAIAIDALGGRTFLGPVARLGKSEDPTTRTMRVEVDLPNPDGLLVEGMYGGATIELQPPSDHLTVPSACVVGHAENGRATVFVVRDGTARRTAVTVGNDDGAAVEILTGVRPDDPVIVRPGSTLDDGAAVETTTAPDGHSGQS